MYVPAKAASAAFSPFNCRATLSLSAFISAIMSMCSPRARIVANNNRRLRGSLHQLEEHAQCLVKLATFRCAEALALLYSVLMNCVTRGFYSFRKSSEIKFENGSAFLPGLQGSAGFRDIAPQRKSLLLLFATIFAPGEHMDIIALIKAERDKVARQLNGLNAPVRESPLLRKRVGQRLKARRFSQSRRASVTSQPQV